MVTISLNDPEVHSYIAFFDLDRTITAAVSGNELALKAYRKGLMSYSDILLALWLLLGYKLSLVNAEKAIYKMTAWVKGIEEDIFQELAEDISHRVLLPSVFPEAAREIRMHTENNGMTVILSSSPVQVCKIIAEALQVDDIICSYLEVVDGYLTGRSVGPLCFGQEKVYRMTAYCEKNNTNPDKCWYYGDALADYPALSIVGHPVCVNPEKKLLKKAREKGWKIYKWL